MRTLDRVLGSSALALLLLAHLHTPAVAAWNAAGNAVASASNVDETFSGAVNHAERMCSDGRGGMIVAWVRAGQDSVMVQRLDHTGARMWNGSTGVLVSHATTDVPSSAGAPSVVSDTDGGCWVAWEDDRAGAAGVYVQHFDADGVPQLTAGGLRVSDATTPSNYMFPLALTPSKKLLIGWVDIGTPDEVRVQRVRTTGALDFGAAGALVDDYDGGLLAPILWKLFADGEGFVAVWEIPGSFAGNSADDLHASRFDANGMPLWGAEGVIFHDGTRVVSGPTVQYHQVADVAARWDESAGLWAAWGRFGFSNGLCIQRLTTAGALQLGTAEQPVTIGTVNVAVDVIGMQPDAGTGAIVGWIDGANVKAQRVNSAGAEQWAATDVIVSSGAAAKASLDVVSDAQGGAYFVYQDAAPGANLDDVVVVRVDPSGATLWTGLARTASTSGAERRPDATHDGAGGLLLAWEDDRDASASTVVTDIYAKHFDASGALFVGQLVLLTPNGGESFESMLPVPITWSSNFGGEVALTYTLSGGSPVTITTATPDDGSFTWFPPPVSSSFVRVQVSVTGTPAVTDASNADFRLCALLGNASLIASSLFIPYDIQSADLDEDGILDLAIAGASGVSVMRGTGAAGVGDGNFASPSLFSLANARRIAIGDFDEDGILDLAVAHAGGVSTLRGNGAAGVGNATYASPVLLPGLASAADVIAADLDNDGVLDLVAADSVGNRIAVYHGQFIAGGLGDGNGDFDAPAFIAVGDQPMALAAGDLDEDGDLDLAVANAGSRTITLLRNTGASGFGSGVFTSVSVFPQPTARPNAVALQDIDGDDDADLLVGTDIGLSVYRNGLISGVPFFETRTDVVGLPIFDFALADLERNGIADILAVGPAGALQLLVGGGSGGVGSGAFTAAGAIATGGGAPASVVAMDFNEDGRLDAVFGNLATHDIGRTLGGCNSLTATPTLAAPDGGDVWTPNTLRSVVWTKPTSLALVDVEVSRDAGANWEPIATRQTGTQFTWKVTHPVTESARVRVRAHNLPHRQDASAADFTICGPFDSVVSVPVTGPVLDAVLLDVDRDGILDLAQAFTAGISIRRGLGAAGIGNGHFGDETLFVARDSARALARIDWDHALGEDLALVTDQGLEIWAAGPTGRIARAFEVGGEKLSSLAVGDIDNDGSDDVAAGSDSARRVLVFRRTAPFVLTPTQTLLSNGRPSAIVLADIQEDGDLDLAWSGTQGAQAVQLSLASSGAVFGAPTNVLSGEAVDLEVADVDENDITDLIALTTAGAHVCLGQGSGGTGNGTFGAPVLVGPTTTGRRLATGDWNADGRLDVLVAGGVGFLGGNVRVFYGLGSGANANGTFAREEMLYTALLPTPIVLGDVLEDGRLDMVLGFPDRTLALLGECAAPPAPITLTSPAGGEAVAAGTLRDITWTKPATGHPVDLDLSLDDGATWRSIAREVAGTRHRWSPPAVASQTSRVRVQDARLRNTEDASDYGFVIYTNPLDAEPGATALEIGFAAPRPNPSRGRTLFALTLPVAGEAVVEVFDLAGRRVRTLAAGTREPGVHRLAWDGLDDHGRAAGPGVYLARARASAFEQSRRFVRLD